jgi:leader peptidase (prepilin peptidase)/N-methyltransferase
MLLFGLVIGSFLNVCAIRIPDKTFFKSARSCCPACRQVIPFYLNIPVLSYVLLRGKAACCGTKISVQYPAIELITGCLFVIIYWQFPFMSFSNVGMVIDAAETLRFCHALIFSCLMLLCSVIDLRLMIIPDVVSIPMILVTPLVVYFQPDLDLKSSLIGTVVGGLSLYIVAWAYWFVRREVGLGFGDVKLLAAIGGWLGYQAIIPTIFLGSVLGALFGLVALVVSKKMNLRSALPFGPFLAIGAFLHLVLGSQLQEWLFLVSQSK